MCLGKAVNGYDSLGECQDLAFYLRFNLFEPKFEVRSTVIDLLFHILFVGSWAVCRNTVRLDGIEYRKISVSILKGGQKDFNNHELSRFWICNLFLKVIKEFLGQIDSLFDGPFLRKATRIHQFAGDFQGPFPYDGIQLVQLGTESFKIIFMFPSFHCSYRALVMPHNKDSGQIKNSPKYTEAFGTDPVSSWDTRNRFFHEIH